MYFTSAKLLRIGKTENIWIFTNYFSEVLVKRGGGGGGG